MMQYDSLPEYAKACGATPDIDHESSLYEATVSQRIWERVIEFGMDNSLLGLATVNKVANAACEPALKCLKWDLKCKAANIMVSIDKYWTSENHPSFPTESPSGLALLNMTRASKIATQASSGAIRAIGRMNYVIHMRGICSKSFPECYLCKPDIMKQHILSTHPVDIALIIGLSSLYGHNSEPSTDLS
jgi:hypothetical protein